MEQCKLCQPVQDFGDFAFQNCLQGWVNMLFTEVNMPFILTLYLIHQCDILIQMIDGADFLEVLLTGRQQWCIQGM